MNNWVVSVFLVLSLTACGGGGGSSASDPSPTSTTPSNSQPNAQNTEITLDEDTEYSGSFSFTDPDGDTLTYSVVEGATNGSFSLQQNGNYTYTPSADYFGQDQVALSVSDGTATVDFTLSIAVQDVKEPTPFNEVAKVLDLRAYPVAQECGKQEIAAGPSVVSEMVFPVNINGDAYTDIFVIFFCPPAEEYFGIEHDLRSINYIIPYLSDDNGSYTAAPVDVFGTEFPQIPHMPRKFVRADFNADGRDDFALAINHDDGRLNQEVPVQAVVLSQPDGKYSIETIQTPEPMMAHAISLARNELGELDILWGGYCCQPDLYAYRYQNGAWVNVSDKYPQSTFVDLENSDWGTETRADMRFGQRSQRLLSHMNYTISDTEKVIGLNLWKERDGIWSINDVYERTTEGVVQFVSWVTGEPQPEPYLTVNGRELLVSGVMTENMCIFEDNDDVTLMLIFPGQGLENSDTFDKDKVYGDDSAELEPVKPLLFFDITNDKFDPLEIDVTDEYLQASGNYFICDDVNDDGRVDIVLQDFSNTWRTDFKKTNSPVIYLRNSDTSFTNINYDPEGLLTDNFNEYIGLLFDMNNDGIMDLVRYALVVRLDLGREETIRIYYGKEHLSPP